MERIKRQHVDTNQSDKTNKKAKLHNAIHSLRSRLEDLANELLYEIFEYLHSYDIYQGFFHLNKRFRNLIFHSNLPLHIHTSTMSKSNFHAYYRTMILPNRHRITVLGLSNPFLVDLIFSPPRFIAQYTHLRSLILENINIKSFDNISTYLIFLPKLDSLILNFAEYLQHPSTIFDQIIFLSQLKSFQITYREKNKYDPYPIDFHAYDQSSVETLVINTRFPVEALDELLSCLPRLRRLSINYLVHSKHTEWKKKPRSIELKYLKYVSFNVDWIRFSRLEELIKNSFRHVEILRLTIRFDTAYLEGNKWEELIQSYMPKLRRFDFNHLDGIDEDAHPRTYHDQINQFNSSFWIENKWFFTHQHSWRGSLHSGIFHSTNPYRRKDYHFYWPMDHSSCSSLLETFHSVQHVHIHSKQATTAHIKYFPNATQLTIENYFQTTDISIPRTLNHLLPLKQLQKLILKGLDFPLDKIIHLLRFTPNLHTLKFGLPSFDQINCELIEQSTSFQYVSTQNQIKHLYLRSECTLEKIQLMVKLFPQLEYFKSGMKKNEMNQIVRFLLSKENVHTHHLFFLCLSEIPKRCLKEFKVLIESEDLLDDYLMKFINRDLYIWW